MRLQKNTRNILLGIIGILILAGAYIGWSVLGPTVRAPEGKYFYIRTGSDYASVKKQLKEQGIIGNTFFFDFMSKRAGYDAKVRPGRYEIKNGSNLLKLVRMLRAGSQSVVRLVIKKNRTKEDLAGRLGRQMEADSLEIINFLNNNDSLQAYGIDSNTVMTAIIPNSYLVWWDGPFSKLFKRLKDQEEQFWDGRRTDKANALGLTKTQVYILASIVEEETNKDHEKGLVASVYANRLKQGMRLEADPTVKFAMKDFQLKRILRGHLDFPSPYNTYRNTGLPPGPICTPSIKTIDAVLNMPQTKFLFFAAKPEFNGYHNFAETYSEHLKNAQAYRKALDELIRSRQDSNP